MTSQVRSSEARWYLQAYVGLWAASLCAGYLMTQYLQKNSFARFFSFYAEDAPGNVATSCLPKPIGVHYFGDFVSAACHAKLPSPYLSEFATNYFPFSYVITKPYAWIMQIGLAYAILALAITAVLTICFPLWKKLSNLSSIDNGVFIVIAVGMSQPFLSMIDRGNIQVFVTGTLMVALFNIDKAPNLSSPILIGMATAIKAYPVVYMLIFVRRREWKQLAISISAAALFSIASLIAFSGGVVANVQAMIDKVLVFHEIQTSWLRYNSSLKGLLISVVELDIRFLSPFSQTVLNQYTLISLLLALSIGVVITKCKVDMFAFSILSAIFCSLLIDLSATYVLTLFIIPMLYLTDNQDFGILKKISLISLAILMVPKGISLTNAGTDHTASLISVVNPIAMIVLFFVTIMSIRPNKRKTMVLGESQRVD